MDLSQYLCMCLGLVVVNGGDARRLRRNGAEIATTIEEPPYTSLKDPNGSGNDNFDGYIPELMAKIAAKIDLDYTFKLVADKKYGTLQPNGQWNGAIGEVMREEARIAAAPLTISDVRSNVVDFTEPIMEMGRTILIKKPASGRPAIQSAQDLADQTEIKYGVVKDGMTHMFFKNSQDPTYRKMWEFMANNPELLLPSNQAGVEKARQGNFAFIMENTTASYYTHRAPCELTMVGGNQVGTLAHHAFVLRMNDPLKPRIDRAITELRNSGELKRLQDKWWRASDCNAAVATLGTSLVMMMLSMSVLTALLV